MGDMLLQDRTLRVEKSVNPFAGDIYININGEDIFTDAATLKAALDTLGEGEFEEITTTGVFADFKVGDVIVAEDSADAYPKVRRKIPPVTLPTKVGRYLTADGRDIVRLDENGKWSMHGLEIEEARVKANAPLDFLLSLKETKARAKGYGGYSNLGAIVGSSYLSGAEGTGGRSTQEGVLL